MLISYSSEWETSQAIFFIKQFGPYTRYLEIGSLNGDSLQSFSTLMEPNSLLICIDKICNDSLTSTIQKLSKSFKVKSIIGDSHKQSTIDRLKEILGNNLLDILFIDGDHSQYGVSCDIHNYVSFVKPNGLIIFHDCGFINTRIINDSKINFRNGVIDVNPCFQSFIFNKPYVLIQEVAGIGIVFNRLLFNEEEKRGKK